MNKQFLFILILLGSLILPLFVVRAEPLSDRALEEFDKGPAALSPTPRSPFMPVSRIGSDVDASTLLVQGIIYGKQTRMALLSGHLVREGETIGRYKVDQIKPEEVSLSQDKISQKLRLENYMPPQHKVSAKDYDIEFRNASLKDALKMLAKGAGLNLVMPEDVAGSVTLSFEDIDLLETLRSLLRVNGYEYAMESGIIRVGKPEAFAGGTDLRTQSFSLKYATAKDMVDKIKPLLSDRGSVIADDRTNTLTIKDRDAVISNLSTFVTQVDRRDEQVQIEARIVDASRNFSRALGIRWGVSGAKDNVSVKGTADVGANRDTNNPLNVNLGAGSPTSGIGMVIGRLAGNTTIEAQLTAAESKGDIHILSKPSVTTLNNMPAKIRSGTKIYVKSTSSINVGTSGGNAASAGTSGLQTIDTGIELTVVPQISIDNFIKMRIDAIESEADFSRTVDGIPAVIDNTASTTVILKDGETTIIGGLYKQKTTRDKRGVPGFQNIPVMGYLFSNRTKTKTDNELMIFITPKIIR